MGDVAAGGAAALDAGTRPARPVEASGLRGGKAKKGQIGGRL